MTFVSMMFLSMMTMIFVTTIVQVAKSQSNDVTKPKEFYFHFIDTPVSVAGLETKYIMNTTKWFKFSTQQEAYINSFYKPADINQPKIVIDFYLYPNLAGPVTINGTWQVFLWVNGSAYKPVGFTLFFKEITVSGTTLWNSGQINPTITSSVGAYIDVPVNNYNLSTTLAHAFSTGTTLQVEVEINAGASVGTRIWYDSPLYPSKVILPVEDYARPVSIKTYAVDNSETNLFYYNWTESQRKVIVRANVTDPFGGYDIYKVNMTILDPSGSAVVNNVDMTRVTDGLWRVRYSHIYEANWSYPETAMLGDYVVKVSVIDNNGYYNSAVYGTFEPFVEEASHIFSIGIIVYYDPVFLIVDDVNASLPKAQVYITWPNGTSDILPRYTSQNGFITLTHVIAGNYGFTILWKDVVVLQTTQYVNSNGPYTLKCRVYQLTVEVLGNTRVPIHGAYVIIYAEGGVGYGLETSDALGKAVFKLPAGTYDIEAHYRADYWLTVVTTKAAKSSVSVANSRSETIIFTDFPPPIWTTTGFWLIIGLVAIAILLTVLVVFRKRLGLPLKGRT